MNGWKTLLECIAIPFAIGYAAVTYQQWRDLRHNFEVDQRAWLKIGSRFSNVTNETEVATAILNPINIGKSPILEAFMDVTSELLPVDKAPSLNLGAQHDRLMMSSIFPGGEPPNDIELRVPSSKAASEYPRKLTRPEVQGLINGTLYVALFGRVVYADQFGKHWQRFCAWHTYEQPPVTIMIVNAKSCVAWNAVGEGDPTK
ncbi:MAG TPA: hypothetical protein VLY24_02935 [Bryobacteraceae bacterium]|nr:hypothetical protein [Bryobacteraceae bacterium]